MNLISVGCWLISVGCWHFLWARVIGCDIEKLSPLPSGESGERLDLKCLLADAQLGKDRQEVERRVQAKLKLPSETAGQVSAGRQWKGGELSTGDNSKRCLVILILMLYLDYLDIYGPHILQIYPYRQPKYKNQSNNLYLRPLARLPYARPSSEE